MAQPGVPQLPMVGTWTEANVNDFGARFEGKPAVRQALASRFEGLPDVHYGNAEHFVDAGRETGMSRWTLTGTTREGRRLEVQGCDFYTFRGDQVVRKDSYWKIVEGS
jgi:ketosteroid isomerase-like protein